MRKTLLLTLALIFCSAIYAQNKGTLLKETFDSTEMPDGWRITGNNSQNWSVSESQFCGGEANEMKLNWQPTFYNGFTRLTSPKIDLTGIDSILVSFKHYVDIYTTYPSTIGIATSSTNGSRWTISYERTFPSDGQHVINEVISNEDMNHEDVMVCIFYKGNSTNLNAIYFDDIEINTIEETNVKISSIDTPVNINSGNADITFSVQNIGTESITSFEASYEIDGKTHSQIFETELAFLETKQFTFDQSISLLPNKYDLIVNITSINNKEDQDINNNTLTKTINVALGSTQRKPMIEHFSSSTCGPCVSVNNYMSNLTSVNPGKYTYTKYVMSFPVPGDPYNTAEGDVKKEYYMVSSVPNVVFNGSNLGATSISQYQLDASYNEPAFVNIVGAFDIDNKNISITADIMSYVDIENVKVFVSINEKTTTGNIGTNGETSFHHVMMKMLPDAYGTDISIKACEFQRLEFTYDMSTTHVEDMNDLEVAVWIQNIKSGEVLNSNYLYDYCEHTYPVKNLDVNKETKTVTWEAPEIGTPSGYSLYINNDLVLANTSDLSYTVDNLDEIFSIEVFANYNEKRSIGVLKTNVSGESITETASNTINIYPNPAESSLFINAKDNINEINIYNVIGVNVHHEKGNPNGTVNISKLNSGIYLIKINTDKGEITKRFIKK